MAKVRTEAGTMVRGMGMGMQVLEFFIKEIKEQGGNEEILAFLIRPRFKENLEKTVKTMVDCDWRIPASEMRYLAEKAYRRDFEVDPEFLEEVKNLWWYAPLSELGIEYKMYSSDPVSGNPAIPPTLLQELHGRKMEYPLTVRKGKYVVVAWGADDKPYLPGDIIDSSKIECISLAESRYFDFDN